MAYKKHTVINDPLYGFISIPHKVIFSIINHPYFQRLRRITQLGLTHYVYPGARHTRFEHALGAFHLMGLSLDALRSKGVEISDHEYLSTQIAILLHDIGHGPFSHTLEHSLVKGVSHEFLSEKIMEDLNIETSGILSDMIAIFKGEYPKKFLHQLVSSQLDMDRMDYLNRDSFYTGVSEGIVNFDRIINKLNVFDNELVIEQKGIYSVEKFLTARRLMYWQVYLHKTTISADQIITGILKRAKVLAQKNKITSNNASLDYFLNQHITQDDFQTNSKALNHFVRLDDFDIMSAIKGWMDHPDKVLNYLSTALINRSLFKVILSNVPINNNIVLEKKKLFQEKFSLNEQDISYLVCNGQISNYAYDNKKQTIKILTETKKLEEVDLSTDLMTISAMAKKVNKYFLCYPK